MIALLLAACVALPVEAAPTLRCTRVSYQRPDPGCVDLFQCAEDGRTWFQTRSTRVLPAVRFPLEGCAPGDGACLIPARVAAESAACVGVP